MIRAQTYGPLLAMKIPLLLPSPSSWRQGGHQKSALSALGLLYARSPLTGRHSKCPQEIGKEIQGLEFYLCTLHAFCSNLFHANKNAIIIHSPMSRPAWWSLMYLQYICETKQSLTGIKSRKKHDLTKDGQSVQQVMDQLCHALSFPPELEKAPRQPSQVSRELYKMTWSTRHKTRHL